MCGRCRRTVSIDPQTKTFRCFKCENALEEAKAPPEGDGAFNRSGDKRVGDRRIRNGRSPEWFQQKPRRLRGYKRRAGLPGQKRLYPPK
jgi:hypothetical protein